MELISRHIDKIISICKNHKVAKLFVLGSVLDQNRFTDDSDVDFIVSFENVEINEYASNYFDLKESLENLLNRPIDLLEEKAIKNPFIIEAINRTKELIYG